jgi:hypothetical protein
LTYVLNILRELRTRLALLKGKPHGKVDDPLREIGEHRQSANHREVCEQKLHRVTGSNNAVPTSTNGLHDEKESVLEPKLPT